MDTVPEILLSYKASGYNIYLIVSFLMSQKVFFSVNVGIVSDKQGESFHKGIFVIEKRYQGKCLSGIVRDFC